MKISSIPRKISSFLKEVRTEIKKVNWPSRREATKYTLIVIGASVIVALFLGGLDYLLAFLRNKFIINQF